MENDIIRESFFRYASQVVLVPKKSVSMGRCIDFRKLNSITGKQKFPLPIIEEQVNNFKTLTTLDLFARYHQMPIDNEAIPKTPIKQHGREHTECSG